MQLKSVNFKKQNQIKTVQNLDTRGPIYKFLSNVRICISVIISQNVGKLKVFLTDKDRLKD